MRDERHLEGLRLPKRRGLHSSHIQPQPKLRRPRHRCAHTAPWNYMVGSQLKYASYRDIQRSLRKLPTGMVCGVSTMETILLEHNQAYRRLNMKCAKMRKLIRSSYHCMHCSWSDGSFMEERNKIRSFNTWKWIGGRKSGGKTTKDTMKVFALILFLFLFLFKRNHTIGHFRVLLCLCFKTSVSAKPFLWKWVLHAVSFSCKSKFFS